MGCGSSAAKGASEPAKAGDKTSSTGNDDNVEMDARQGDEEFMREVQGKKVKYDKKTGKLVEGDAYSRKEGRPEDDIFEFEAAGGGDQFMAVKPWLGALVAPSKPPHNNPVPPEESYELEYVYGYRCEDSRQNLFYTSKGEVAYMTAALGVVLNKATNTQRFFGGGEVSMKAKNTSDSATGHTDDITALAISNDRKLICTGQVGKAPTIFIWNAETCAVVSKFKLPSGTRGVSAVGFSSDGKFVALADLHNDHNVYVFDTATGKSVYTNKGGPDKILDLSFTQKAGSYAFTTVGIKHINFWEHTQGVARKGIFGAAGKMTNFASVATDDKGVAYIGGANGEIYIWDFESRQLQSTVKAHDGVIHAIRYINGTVLSGGADNKVIQWKVSGKTLTQTQIIPLDSFAKSLDQVGDNVLIGLRDGSIVELNAKTKAKTVLMQSHSDGEAWGLAVVNDHTIASTGDDNKVMVWDTKARKCTAVGTVNKVAGDKKKIGGASTLSRFPPNQCARAIAHNKVNGHIAVADNDGGLSIRASITDLDSIVAQNNDSKEWIEIMQFSPDGKTLAVGSHDNFIYIYDVQNGYKQLGKLKGHSSFITSLDWSQDGRYIASNCGSYELLFFDVKALKQDPSGATNTKDLAWASQNNKLGYTVQGIFPPGTDGSHINGVSKSHSEKLIATGDDYGLVNIFRNPALDGAQSKSLRGHSEHVVRVLFSTDDSRLFSIGGYDQTIMQWKKK